MSIHTSQAPVRSYNGYDYERAVVNSALWAAAGDALGWITELSHGANGVLHRTGSRIVNEPVAWKRLIGGRSGVKVDLPAGTYSDDTQLRLCVSRCIRANGAFDVEAFAKVEVTTWQGYCLGAGVGSKAAAANLAKRGVNWFSNFYATDKQKYVSSGGNGAAMRIQPHVWSSRGTVDELTMRVMRDSVVTHGHPHGFCGAIFHALCIWDTLQNRRVPSIEMAKQYVSYIKSLPALLENDSELSSFWLPNWERETGKSFTDAIHQFHDEAQVDICMVDDLFKKSSQPDYHEILSELGCLTNKYRGSGFKTALAALMLSLIYSSHSVEEALIRSANELESDTDTIATMSGAIIGAIADQAPVWAIQDLDYLRVEAKRMASIARKEHVQSFPYPDLSNWEPPTNQSDAVILQNNALTLSGIGKLKPKGQAYKSGTSIWQWCELPFGQSILAKRRASIMSLVKETHIHTESPDVSQAPEERQQQASFELKQNDLLKKNPPRSESASSTIMPEHFPGLDKATDIIISSGFDSTIIGHMINLAIEDTGSIEAAVGLSAIIAKAKIARMRRK